MARTSLYSLCVAEFQRSYLLKELNLHGWNRHRTALELGISYRGLLYKIKNLGLTPPEKDDYSRSEGAA